MFLARGSGEALVEFTAEFAAARESSAECGLADAEGVQDGGSVDAKSEQVEGVVP